jgi:hypothetical protein
MPQLFAVVLRLSEVQAAGCGVALCANGLTGLITDGGRIAVMPAGAADCSRIGASAAPMSHSARRCFDLAGKVWIGVCE